VTTETRNSINPAPKGWAILAALGPGIVWAGMAIGGGELALNPRVGAVWGISTLWMPIVAIFLKWFLTVELGRWSLYTGTSIREGFTLLPGPKKWLNWAILLAGLYLGAIHIGGLVAMIGIIANNIVPALSPYVWSVIIMISFVALSWAGKYSIIEKSMMVVVGILTVSTFFVFVKLWPGLGYILQGFTFQIPGTTPDWAVQNFKVSPNPLVEIIPAMAFAGAGAINGLWYSDWILSKGYGTSGGYELGSSDMSTLDRLKNVTREDMTGLKDWFKVMLHDSWWGANMLTILVTAIFVINACVVLNPLKLAPGGVAFVLTLSKTFTKVLGEWAMTLYLVGSFAVVYSTMATLYDGYARLIDNSIKICLPDFKGYHALSNVWRYRIWFLYGTIGNFALVFMFQAVPIKFLQAAAWVEGAILLPFVAFSIAYLTYKILPGLYPENLRDQVRPHPIFTCGTIAAGVFYAAFLIYSIM